MPSHQPPAPERPGSPNQPKQASAIHNPFNFGAPVPPGKFVGRWPEAEKIVNDLLNPGGHSYAVVGGRRVGKSSLLEAVQHLLVQKLNAYEPGDWIVLPLFINLKWIPAAADEQHIFGFVLRQLHKLFTSERIRRKMGLTFNPMAELNKTLLADYGKRKQATCSLDEFTEIIDDLLQQIEQAHSIMRIVLLIDEIDIFIACPWAEVLFSLLRSIIYQGLLRDEIRYVLAGSSRVIELREAGSPFFNMLKLSFLESMTDQNIAEIISWAGQPSDELTQAVISQCGGSPYLVQYLMHHLWPENHPGQVMPMTRKFCQEQYAELQVWADDIGNAGLHAYQVLAETSQWLTLEQIRAMTAGYSLEIGDSVMTRLCYHGFAIRDEAREHYHYSGELFRNWFSALPKKKRAEYMNIESFAQLKARLQQQRIANLAEEYEAVHAQMDRTLEDATRLRLGRQLDHLASEIQKLETELTGSHVRETTGATTSSMQVQLAALQAQVNQLQEQLEEEPVESQPSLLRLQLLRQDENGMTVRGVAVPGGGQPRATVPLPYTLTQLPAILKALDVGAYDPKRFKPAYVQALTDLGLLRENRLSPDFHAQVGQALYRALFAGEIGDELHQAQRASQPILCQLQFDPEDVVLTQFPWELIHDGVHFGATRKKGIAVTRSIAFAAPPPPLQLKPPLRLLLISPRPQGEDALLDQATAVQTGLAPLAEAGQVSCLSLAPRTWAALEETLYRETFDIIHFDGHGSFARECPACGAAHYPSQEQCVRCAADMRQAAPQGYLHFEDEQGQLDRVNLADTQTALADSEAQLIFLSACGSGVTHGVSVFNGIAPALIRLGTPAVVAMQASPPDGSSALFVQRFYDSLAQGMTIETAVGNGRRAIFRPLSGEPVSWFMPVIYSRHTNAG